MTHECAFKSDEVAVAGGTAPIRMVMMLTSGSPILRTLEAFSAARNTPTCDSLERSCNPNDQSSSHKEE